MPPEESKQSWNSQAGPPRPPSLRLSWKELPCQLCEARQPLLTTADRANTYLLAIHTSTNSFTQKHMSKILYIQMIKPTLGLVTWICPPTPASKQGARKCFPIFKGWG